MLIIWLCSATEEPSEISTAREIIASTPSKIREKDDEIVKNLPRNSEIKGLESALRELESQEDIIWGRHKRDRAFPTGEPLNTKSVYEGSSDYEDIRKLRRIQYNIGEQLRELKTQYAEKDGQKVKDVWEERQELFLRRDINQEKVDKYENIHPVRNMFSGTGELLLSLIGIVHFFPGMMGIGYGAFWILAKVLGQA